MDDEPKRPVAMCLTELNSCEDDAMDHGLRPVFEADDMQVAQYRNTAIIIIIILPHDDMQNSVMLHVARSPVCLQVTLRYTVVR